MAMFSLCGCIFRKSGRKNREVGYRYSHEDKEVARDDREDGRRLKADANF